MKLEINFAKIAARAAHTVDTFGEQYAAEKKKLAEQKKKKEKEKEA